MKGLKKDVLWLFLAVLSILYLIVPANIGVVEVDSRISFFLVMLFIIIIVCYVQNIYKQIIPVCQIVILTLIGINFIG